MNRGTAPKEIIFYILWKMQVDRLFRHFNHKRILILAYHGVTKKKYEIFPWPQIHVNIFERQIKYISQRYNVISLIHAAECIMSKVDLPRKPAVITFDDGYRNNYTVALPILRKYGIPATIFVTAGYVGSSRILPLDEAYAILFRTQKVRSFSMPQIGLDALYIDTPQKVLEAYQQVVCQLKGFSAKKQKEYLDMLREALEIDKFDNQLDIIEDFRLLSWDEIRSMLETGLIHIGAHTVSHEILTNLSVREAVEEIVDSKSILQENLGCTINLFAYPNGSEADYDDRHIECLKENGFICSVNTTPKLNKIFEDPYRLGRICIGPDSSSNPSHFALRVSGFIPAMKSLARL